MGRSVSYSVADQNMYRLLLDYMKKFASVNKKIVKKVHNEIFEMSENVM